MWLVTGWYRRKKTIVTFLLLIVFFLNKTKENKRKIQLNRFHVLQPTSVAVTLYAALLLIYFLFNMTGKDKATGKLKKENAYHTY